MTEVVTPHDAARILGDTHRAAIVVCDGEQLPVAAAVEAVMLQAVEHVDVLEPNRTRRLTLVGF